MEADCSCSLETPCILWNVNVLLDVHEFRTEEVPQPHLNNMDGSRKAVHCYCTEKLKWVDVYNQIIHTANAFESESHSEVGT